MGSEDKKQIAKADPVELEVKKVPTVTLDFRGQEWVLPASIEKAPFRMTLAIEEKQFGHAILHLMSANDRERFLDLELDNDEAGEFFSEYTKLIGLNTAGE